MNTSGTSGGARGRLSGKRAFVTAAGQGIGRATAIAFAAEGAEVVATDIDAGKLEGLAAHGIATAALDVTDGAVVSAAAEEAGAVDVLFNGVGYVHHGSVLECDDAAWARSFDINVTSMHRTIRAFLPAMLERGAGSIINMSSAASSVKGAPNRYAYGTTKAAVIGLTKSVAADFIGRGIRVNAICPATVHSPSWEERVKALGATLGDEEEARRQFIARQPMGRIGTPEEIAALAVYLASDESGFTTGQALVVDGGWCL